MTQPATKPDRTLLIILIGIAVLVVVAALIVFTRGAPKLLDADTPQGVVQRYVAALLEGDKAEARRFLDRDIREQCDQIGEVYTDGLRVVLSSTAENGNTADVEVSLITSSGGGLFGPSEYASADTFRLIKADNEWLIREAPWSLTICTGSADF